MISFWSSSQPESFELISSIHIISILCKQSIFVDFGHDDQVSEEIFNLQVFQWN
jgi:hypothetical protein